jgi:hypothetical protein
MQRRRMGHSGQPRTFPQRDRIRALGSDQFIHRLQQCLTQFPVMVFLRHIRILAAYLDNVKIMG